MTQPNGTGNKNGVQHYDQVLLLFEVILTYLWHFFLISLQCDTMPLLFGQNGDTACDRAQKIVVAIQASHQRRDEYHKWIKDGKQ
jgi:hypothetical protein